MPKNNSIKTRARTSKGAKGLGAKLRTLPLFAKLLIALVVLGSGAFLASYIYSRVNEDKLSIKALDQNYALTRWTKLGESIGRGGEYRFYACQTVDEGDNHYIRAIVTKPPRGSNGSTVTNLPIRATIITYWSDGATIGEHGIKDNRTGPGGLDFSYWGDEITAPLAKVEHDGWWQAKFGGNGNVNDPDGGNASHTFPKYSALFTPGCTPADQVHLDQHHAERLAESERVAAERRMIEEEQRRLAEEARLAQERANAQAAAKKVAEKIIEAARNVFNNR